MTAAVSGGGDGGFIVFIVSFRHHPCPALPSRLVSSLSSYIFSLLYFFPIGRYAYIIHEGNDHSKSPTLIFSPFTGSQCISFHYILLGDNQTKLTLSSGHTQVFIMNGNQGNEWKKALINVTGLTGKVSQLD